MIMILIMILGKLEAMLRGFGGRKWALEGVRMDTHTRYRYR